MPHTAAHTANASALKLAESVQAAISARGFDWPDAHGVIDKIREEIGEIEGALADDDLAHARRELGDLLLVSVNLARFLTADPEQVLLDALARFQNRCQTLDAALSARGLKMESCTLAQLDSVWEEVKVLADQGSESGA
jgi:ATP diphosphatase